MAGFVAGDDDQPGLFGPDDATPASPADELIYLSWGRPDDAEPEDDLEDSEAWLASLPPDVRADYLASASRPAPWDRDGDANPAAFASGGFFDTMLPGHGLAEALEQVTSAGHAALDDDALAGVLQGWQRQVAWTQAGLVMAVSALAGRRLEESERPGSSRVAEHVRDELAVELTMTGRSAARLLELTARLRRLDGVHDALLNGAIDWTRACVFTDELAVLDDDAARQIAGSLLDQACGWTTGQLRAALVRAVLAADPGAAQRRKQAGRTDSRVEAWTELSGNAALAGRELRPADVIAIDAQLSADARWLQSHGVPGTICQLRSLAYTTLLSGRELASVLDDPTGWPHDGHPEASQTHGDGRAPLPDGTAVSRDDTAVPPDGGAPLRDSLAVSRHGSAAPRPGGVIHLTMPLSAWTRLTDNPGEVAGHGPVDADTSRELAEVLSGDSATRWCLTVTGADGRAVGHACARRGPASGEPAIRWAAALRGRMRVLEHESCSHARQAPGYLAPVSLRHLIQVRQGRCSFPGCRRAARRCDLDHTVPFDKGGLTCECNLSPLCRRHHRAKQVPGWQLTQDQPGHLTWRLPSGRSYQTPGELYPV